MLNHGTRLLLHKYSHNLHRQFQSPCLKASPDFADSIVFHKTPQVVKKNLESFASKWSQLRVVDTEIQGPFPEI